jgi:hypothetical protein
MCARSLQLRASPLAPQPPGVPALSVAGRLRHVQPLRRPPVQHKSPSAAGKLPGSTTLEAWLAAAHAVDVDSHEVNVTVLLRRLKRLKVDAVQAQAAGIVSALVPLLQYAVRGGVPMQVFLEELSHAVAPHETVLRLLHQQTRLSAVMSLMFKAAAQQPETYSSHVCRMAVEQYILGHYCDTFWQELERRGLEELDDASSVSTLLLMAGALAARCGPPGPSRRLWEQLDNEVVRFAEHMGYKAIAGVLQGCALLQRAPSQRASELLLRAVACNAPQMRARDVAQLLRTTTSLQMKLDSSLRSALVAALAREPGELNAEQVCDTLVTLAKRRKRDAHGALSMVMTQAMRTCEDMTAGQLVETLRALATLERSVCCEARAGRPQEQQERRCCDFVQCRAALAATLPSARHARDRGRAHSCSSG